MEDQIPLNIGGTKNKGFNPGEKLGVKKFPKELKGRKGNKPRSKAFP